MMKTLLNASSIQKTLMAVAFVAALALPVMASAAYANISVSYSKDELKSVHGRQNVYERMQDASRKLCGSSNVRLASSMARSAAHEECYNGTLTAAVERLDVPEITALHNQ
jgi:UrcA family protein